MSDNKLYAGEVIFKERFGSTPSERLYVKPSEQAGVVVVNIGYKRDVSGWFTKIFLPQGYPETVSKDYLAYQLWDTAQAFCSTITGILATQEVLRGVGVGDSNATPLAATITWVLKDGCGHVGKILFAYSHGKYLDAYSKKWRMYADILNNAAMCIEIALPQFKVYSLFALCISTVMKAIVGVAGGATRVAMTQHHAIMGNLADVSAKDSAQETAVNLVASVVSLLIITCFGTSLFIFVCLMILHVTFNYFAVRAVCLRTLNEPRFLLAIDEYLRKEMIATPCEINRKEPIIFYQLGPCILDIKICGFKINLGSSMHHIFGDKIKVSDLSQLKDIYRKRNYLLIPQMERRTMHVLIKEKANADDILCAYFHAVLLSIITCALNDEPLAVYKNEDPRPFAQVCATLQCVEWSRDEASTRGFGFAHRPSEDLLIYLNKIVANEWPRVRNGLKQTGWDLSKHLLILDQWRLSSPHSTHITAKQVTTENEGQRKQSATLTDNESGVKPNENFSYSNIVDKLLSSPQIPKSDNTIELPDDSQSSNLSNEPLRPFPSGTKPRDVSFSKYTVPILKNKDMSSSTLQGSLHEGDSKSSGLVGESTEKTRAKYQM